MDPQPAYALGRGLKTLPLRVARHNANARAVADFLAADRRVSQVYYPGLPSHPDHEIARRQMTGFGGMVCFDLDGRYDRAERFYDRLKIVKRAASLGGIESLISMPVLTSQWGHTDEQLRAAGVTKGMLRLSVGLEDVGGSDRGPGSGARELRIKNLELRIRERVVSSGWLPRPVREF